jgi:hypothetical protein
MDGEPIVLNADRKLASYSPFATPFTMHNRAASGASYAGLQTCSSPDRKILVVFRHNLG